MCRMRIPGPFWDHALPWLVIPLQLLLHASGSLDLIRETEALTALTACPGWAGDRRPWYWALTSLPVAQWRLRCEARGGSYFELMSWELREVAGSLGLSKGRGRGSTRGSQCRGRLCLPSLLHSLSGRFSHLHTYGQSWTGHLGSGHVSGNAGDSKQLAAKITGSQDLQSAGKPVLTFPCPKPHLCSLDHRDLEAPKESAPLLASVVVPASASHPSC